MSWTRGHAPPRPCAQRPATGPTPLWLPVTSPIPAAISTLPPPNFSPAPAGSWAARSSCCPATMTFPAPGRGPPKRSRVRAPTLAPARGQRAFRRGTAPHHAGFGQPRPARGPAHRRAAALAGYCPGRACPRRHRAGPAPSARRFAAAAAGRPRPGPACRTRRRAGRHGRARRPMRSLSPCGVRPAGRGAGLGRPGACPTARICSRRRRRYRAWTAAGSPSSGWTKSGFSAVPVPLQPTGAVVFTKPAVRLKAPAHPSSTPHPHSTPPPGAVPAAGTTRSTYPFPEPARAPGHPSRQQPLLPVSQGEPLAAPL